MTKILILKSFVYFEREIQIFNNWHEVLIFFFFLDMKTFNEWKKILWMKKNSLNEINVKLNEMNVKLIVLCERKIDQKFYKFIKWMSS